MPGYESVGTVVQAGPDSGMREGQTVFVPGAKCFGEVRGLFGASASRLVVAEKRVVPLDQALAIEAEIIGRLCGSEDKREGTTAFLEKRTPHWVGR